MDITAYPGILFGSILLTSLTATILIVRSKEKDYKTYNVFFKVNGDGEPITPSFKVRMYDNVMEIEDKNNYFKKGDGCWVPLTEETADLILENYNRIQKEIENKTIELHKGNIILDKSDIIFAQD